jgi:hypothetical protein
MSNKETHVSILKPTHEKLKYIANYEKRTMRVVITKLIDKEYNKVKK